MQYGCIAERLGHSFSPEIHAELADYSYELCEVRPENLDAFMRARDFCGINVTIPYKEQVIPYLYEIDVQAKMIGAVNTVVNREGRLYGYNTDFYGLSALIAHLGLNLAGKKVAVLGTGGTSKTARAVAAHLGACEVLCVSRCAKEGIIDYQTLLKEHTDIRILINTTPCGMFPNADTVAVDINAFPKLCGVVDAVYNPLCPQLVCNARKRGIPAEGGLYMLVAQAVRASEIFTGRIYPADVTERIWRKLTAKKQNIVLIGMPGCGKSTVGRLLADKLGRELIDTDAEIVRVAGKTVPDIFAERGEAGFRDLESQVIRELSSRNGIVLATGGGAILREGNADALTRNGRLYFIDRPLEQLLPTEDRPLASSTEAIRRRYEERYHRYCAVADVRIAVDGDAVCVAEQVGKDFYEHT